MSRIPNGTKVEIDGYGGVATVISSDFAGISINGNPFYEYSVQFGTPPKGSIHNFYKSRMTIAGEGTKAQPKTPEQELEEALALLKEKGII